MQASIRAATMKEVAEVISRFVQEGAVTFDGSLKFEAMDPAKISAVYLDIPRSAFQAEGQLNAAETFGLSWEDLNRMLARVDKDDTLILETSGEGQAGRLKITATGRSVKQFSIPLLDLEKFAAPNIELQSEFSVDCREFLYAVDTVTVMGSEAVAIQVDGEASQAVLSLSSEHEVYGKAEVTVGREDFFPGQQTRAGKAYFNAGYLKNAVRGEPHDLIKVQLETDKPLKIRRTIANGLGSLDVLLAPRVEEATECMTDQPVNEAEPGKREVQQEVQEVAEAEKIIEQIKDSEEEEPSPNVRRLVDTPTDSPDFAEVLGRLTDEEIDYICRNCEDDDILGKVEEEVERRRPR